MAWLLLLQWALAYARDVTTKRRNAKSMPKDQLPPLDISVLYEKPQPFYAELGEFSIGGRYDGEIMTPSWMAHINVANARSDEEFVRMLCELVTEWNVATKPPAFEPGETFQRESLCAHEGHAYRALNDGEAGQEPPRKPQEPETLGAPPEGETEAATRPQSYRSGDVEFEREGSARDSRVVPITAYNVSRIPVAIHSTVFQACVQAHNTGVQDEKGKL